MPSTSVPWTIFYLTSSGVAVKNVTASAYPPLAARYYNEESYSWSSEECTSSVKVICGIRGHHAVTAHIPSEIAIQTT